jgi:purine-nucleoside phosphorylase
MTPHNKAKLSDIAKVVLMPGDPLRAKWIAENFLKSPKLVNDVRGMFAYTGAYKNKKVTVMAHGMGMPSIGIYSYELFKFYNVNTIIRVGSAGAFTKSIKLGDVIVAKEAFSESIYAQDVGVKVPKNKILNASSKPLNLCLSVARQMKIEPHVGKVLCEDVFYSAMP